MNKIDALAIAVTNLSETILARYIDLPYVRGDLDVARQEIETYRQALKVLLSIAAEEKKNMLPEQG
jgi:hypothetical protein